MRRRVGAPGGLPAVRWSGLQSIDVGRGRGLARGLRCPPRMVRGVALWGVSPAGSGAPVEGVWDPGAMKSGRPDIEGGGDPAVDD